MLRYYFLPVLTVASLTFTPGCRQSAQRNGDTTLARNSNANTKDQSAPVVSPSLYATPDTSTTVASSELDPPDILTLREKLKTRRLKPGEIPSIPPEAVLERSFDIAGVWTTGSGFEGWTLRLSRRSGDEFDVVLSFWDCTSREQTEGFGRYQDGVLTLDFPVINRPVIGIGDFETLRALRVGGFPILAAPAEAESLLEFETMCEAAHVEMKEHLVLRPRPTFIREDDYR